jgi:hypothetical protein
MSKGLLRLFKRETLRALSQRLLPLDVKRVLQCSIATPHLKLKDALNHAYERLQREHRGEYLYKNELINQIVLSQHTVHSTSIQTEFRIGTSIADVAVFNGLATGYELKTELDSLRRLPTQIQDYLKVFDNVFVVTATGWVEEALAILPETVGILGFDEDSRITHVRSAVSNSEALDAEAVFQCLRRIEYLEALRASVGWEPGCAPAHTYTAAKEIFCSLEIDVARMYALEMLRARSIAMGSAQYYRRIPYSLRATAFSEPLSRIGQSRLLERLNSPVAAL